MAESRSVPQQSVRVGVRGRCVRIFERKTTKGKIIYVHSINVPESGIVRVNSMERFAEPDKDVSIWANVQNDGYVNATQPQFWFAAVMNTNANAARQAA